MKNTFLLIVAIATIANALSIKDSLVQNWNGYNDTGAISGALVDGTLKYTRWFKLTDYRYLRVIAKVNDTASAGFASDSVNFQWGYQTGSPCQRSTGAPDTCVDEPVTVDSMIVDSFGVINKGVFNFANGTITRYSGGVDTSNVSGWATQSRNISPEWDCLVRFWVNSLGDPNRNGNKLSIIFDVKRQIYDPTRAR